MSANPRGVYALPPRVRNFNRHRAKWNKAKRSEEHTSELQSR